ncbi:uncharacterized protein IL334_000675 [Kwoniella shivajii]|uniref:Uncharacterized protein n=1 Tax=Kwoniella shivajii TaxID=564305 RepID=A0ABZ1CQ47_9TREE|nr:hypothetical protein IL334_000675 [Kwoniella shivajii]
MKPQVFGSEMMNDTSKPDRPHAGSIPRTKPVDGVSRGKLIPERHSTNPAGARSGYDRQGGEGVGVEDILVETIRQVKVDCSLLHISENIGADTH